MTYRLRMRNVPGPERGTWATLVLRMRTASGITGAELARRLNVDRATVWRWESGKQKPESLPIVQAFADIFALDLDEALIAAGMRPSTDDEPRPQASLDPDVAELMAIFADPHTPQATKDQVRQMLRALLELAESRPRAPRRRKATG